MEMLARSRNESMFVALHLYVVDHHRRSVMCRLVCNVRMICGGITSVGFSVALTSSSLSRVDPS